MKATELSETLLGHLRVHSVTAGDLRRRLDPPGA